jgi:hypothetical protein
MCLYQEDQEHLNQWFINRKQTLRLDRSSLNNLTLLMSSNLIKSAVLVMQLINKKLNQQRKQDTLIYVVQLLLKRVCVKRNSACLRKCLKEKLRKSVHRKTKAQVGQALHLPLEEKIAYETISHGD